MSPEETVAPPVESAAPAPAPEPAPAPVSEAPAAPPAAPEPLAASPDPLDERTQPPSDMWKAILDQSGTPPVVEKAAERPQTPPRPTERLPQGPGVTPAAPKRWAGRYESPEQLESGFTEVQQARDRAETERQRAVEHAERMERLLQAAMGQRGAPVDGQWVQPAPPQPQGPHPMLKEALQAIQIESERLALGDPQGDPLRLVRAVALASQLDAESRRVYVDSAHSEVESRTSAQQQIQQVQTQFFTEYPDLRTARPSLLRQIAIETEDQLRQTRRDYGSAQYMRAWFDETAKQARASIRVGDGTASAPTAGSPSRPPTTQSSARPRSGAPFAETPAPRPQEPVLAGQDVHLARVFGRGA